MALTIALDGNVLLQLTPDARPQNVPVKFTSTYTKKCMNDFGYTTSQSHVAVPQGTVTAPRFILVWVDEGEIELSWDSLGANPTVISANPSPPPEESPVWILMRYAPDAGQLYLTCTGVASGKIWLFQ